MQNCANSIQGFTWLLWAIPEYSGLYKAILGCTGLCMLRYTGLFCGEKVYTGLYIEGYTVFAAAAIAIEAKV